MRNHGRIVAQLQSVQQDLTSFLNEDMINQACHQAGHTWRKRILTPVVIFHWLLQQILLENTALKHVSLLANRSFTDSAYCQARQKLPLKVFEILLAKLISSLQLHTKSDGLWNGHRTFLIDGSAVSMPDTPELQSKFGQPGGQAAGCGFPVAKILAMFHATQGFLMKVAVAPLRTHELSQVGLIYPMLQSGDLMVGDRGFCSYLHIARLVKHGVHSLFRVHQRQKVDFTKGRKYVRPNEKGKYTKGLPRSRQVRKLAPLDQLVDWYRPDSLPEFSPDGKRISIRASLRLRELQYDLAAKGFRTKQVTLVTTLTDAEKYTAESLAELYGIRWRVEQNLRDLKQTLGMDILKCKYVDGVMKEIYAFVMIYNLVRLVAMEASRRQGVPPERISFIDALRWLRMVQEEESEMMHLIVNPLRLNRFEPRVRKRRPKQFPVMKTPRKKWKEAYLLQGVAA